MSKVEHEKRLFECRRRRQGAYREWMSGERVHEPKTSEAKETMLSWVPSRFCRYGNADQAAVFNLDMGLLSSPVFKERS